MGSETTMQTSRGDFLEELLRPVVETFEKNGSVDEVLARLRVILNSTALVRVNQMIDTMLMPELRVNERRKEIAHRMSDQRLQLVARTRTLRAFGALLSTCLRKDRPDAFDAVLTIIEEVGIFGAKEFRKSEAHLLPGNPIVHYRAIAEAWISGKSVAAVLGNAQKTALALEEAALFLAQLQNGAKKGDPGNAKIHALQLRDAHPALTNQGALEAPQAATPQDFTVPLTFRGAEEIALLRTLLRAAKKHGGLKPFLLLMAKKLGEQK